MLSLALGAMLGTAKAQDLNSQMSLANKAWKAGDYPQCQQAFAKIVKVYGPRSKMLYGPKFGGMYYRKGIVELKMANISKRGNNQKDAQKWFQAAAESLETCHEEYANGAPDMAKTTNLAYNASLQRWAEACMGLGDYEKALELYLKFKKERGPKDKFLPTPGGFYVNLATCHFLKSKPDVPEGIKVFEIALKNKVKMKTSGNAITAGFLALSQAVVADKNEQAMVDFLNKNRAAITMESYQMYDFIPVLLKLAGNSLRAEMYVASFNLYAMIPGSDEIIQDIKVREEQLGGRLGIKDGLNVIELARLQKTVTQIKKRQSEGKSHDAQVLTAMAYLHDIAGNQRGTLGVLDQLELYYKKNVKRETNLFNLVRVSSVLGEIGDTEKYGSLFLKDFPASDQAEVVRRLMLSSLFFNREYEKSLRLSEGMISDLPTGTEQHDICLFVLAGSHFYLGHFDKAQPQLDKYVQDYPEGKFIMHAEYYQASNLTRMQQLSKAAKKLDAFLSKYSDPAKNIYMPNALFDRASCHFTDGENDAAMQIIEKLQTDFSKSSVIGMAYNMQGNIQESDEKLEEAEKSYLEAYDISKKRGNKSVAGETLSYLVGMLCIQEGKKPNPRAKDSVPYYDIFMKDYPDSQFKPQVVVYGFPGMQVVGRTKEGLKNMQSIIPELAKRKNSAFLEESVNAYTKAYLEQEGNTPDNLKNLYYNFPEIDLKNQRVLALLRIAIIGVFEGEKEKAVAVKDEDAILKYESSIKVLFRDLKTEFNPSDLTNFVLLKVADYLREKTSAPKQAIPYYEELLNRKDKFGEFKARFGIADILGNSDNDSENKKAITQLEAVYKLAKKDKDKTTQGKALYRLTEINAKLGNWAQVETKGRMYLSEKHTKKAAQVSYLFAKSFDERKKVDDALANYAMVYARYPGYISISAPSVKRVMEMMWARDLPVGAKVGKVTLKIGDRQSAYSEIGYKFIASTTRIRESNKLTDAEAADWDEVAALVKKYENSGLVKTVAQLKEERLKNRHGR